MNFSGSGGGSLQPDRKTVPVSMDDSTADATTAGSSDASSSSATEDYRLVSI